MERAAHHGKEHAITPVLLGDVALKTGWGI
jgi:hypothetical protein